MSEKTDRQRQRPPHPDGSSSADPVERLSRTAGHTAGSMLDTAVHLPRDLPAATGKAATTAFAAARHPEALVERARKLSLALPMLRQAVTPILTGRVDWRAEDAYTLGVQGFIYGFPYIYNAQLRHDWVTQERDTDVAPYAAVNHFWHAAHPLDATYRDGGCPNTDTLYPLAWLDLRDEPVILSHPDMGERYFTFQVAAFTSDNVDYVGQRTTGAGAGDFAITGPTWKGDLPGGGPAAAAVPHAVGARARAHPRRRVRGPALSPRPDGPVPAHPAQRLGPAAHDRPGPP
jgi:hypothetical protein